MIYDYKIRYGAVTIKYDYDGIQYFCTKHEKSKTIDYWDNKKKRSDILESFFNIVKKGDCGEDCINKAIDFCSNYGLPFNQYEEEAVRIKFGDRISFELFFDFHNFMSNLSDLAMFYFENSHSGDLNYIAKCFKYIVKIISCDIGWSLNMHEIYTTSTDTTYLYSFDTVAKTPDCSSFEIMMKKYLSEISSLLNEFSDSDQVSKKRITTAYETDQDIYSLFYNFYLILWRNIPLSHFYEYLDMPSKYIAARLEISEEEIPLINSFISKFITDHLNALLQYYPRQFIFTDNKYTFRTVQNREGCMGALVQALSVMLESQIYLKKCAFCNRTFFPDYKHPQQETCGKDCSQARYDKDKRAKRKLEREAERDFPNIKKIEYK